MSAKLPLPQPLTYLLSDVARRHGSVRVTSVVCCVVSPDEALLAEIVRGKALTSLGLRLLAPTVLAAAKPVAQTLQTLRAAGYAPVEQSAAGQVVVERVEQRRTESGGAFELAVALRPAADEVAAAAEATTLAAALRGSSPLMAVPAVRGLTIPGRVATRIGSDGVRVLGYGIETGEPVVIDYEEANKRSVLLVSRMQGGRDGFRALSHVRGDTKFFQLSGLHAVVPVIPMA